LLVHFPGGMKAAIANMTSKWLQSVPVLPSTAATTSPALFTITRAASCTVAGNAAAGSTTTKTGSTAAEAGSNALKAGQLVQVTMHSNLYDKESKMKKEFALCVQPQSEGFSNFGWPIAPQPQHFPAILQRQLQQRQDQQQLRQ
jgi:hypothetical protein